MTNTQPQATSPKVSVIIPVYGVEKFIERCARSLFSQTLDSLEYIFVNDCTKDRSIDILKEVLEEYPERKPQVRIIDMPVNSGQAKVREVGIKAATGEYLIHCDSDDWVETDMYETMYLKAKSQDADICYCDTFYDYVGSQQKKKTFPEDYSFTRDNILRSTLLGKVIGTLWLYMSHRRLYSNNILYPQNNLQEDFVLTIELLYYSKNPIIYVPRYFYHYNPENVNSICHIQGEEQQLKRHTDTVKNIALIVSFFEMNNATEEFQDYYTQLKYKARNFIAPLIGQKKYYRMWREVYPEIDGYRILKDKNLSWKSKIVYLILYFRLMPCVKKVLRFLGYHKL